MSSISQGTIDRSVFFTIQLFGIYATILMNNATAIYNEVSGLTPPAGISYGRYYASGNPLLPYEFSTSSVATLIEQATTLRAAVVAAIGEAVTATQVEPITDLLPKIYAVVAALMACGATPLDQINMMMILAGFQAQTYILAGTDTIGRQMTDLAVATARQVRIAALHNLAAATAAYTPNSQGDAISLRNVVMAMISNEMVICATLFDDADYTALNADRIAVSVDLNARGSNLAPVVSQTFSSNLPSLVLAHRLYQTARMEPDLVARNNPVDPGSMPLTIEALATANV